MRDYIIYYFSMFVFIFVCSFYAGRQWEKLNQEEQKSRDTIKYIPKKNKW